MSRVRLLLNARWLERGAAAASLVAVFAGCTSAACDAPCVRVTNSGEMGIRQLSIGFPKERIDFGDVPAGATTEYEETRYGVYGYAAFQFELDGRIEMQPVIDWVAEPLRGRSFTYDVQLVLFEGRQEIQIIEVRTDRK